MSSRGFHLFIAALGAGFVVTTGCGATAGKDMTTYTLASGTMGTASAMRDAARNDCALVRFVNAHRAGTAQNLYFGGLRAFHEVSYKAVTPYVELPGERRDFRLFVKKDDTFQEVSTNNEGLWEGRRYTVISSSRPDGLPMVQAFHDDLAVPGSGKARVRLIHVAPSAPQLDVYTNSGKSLISNVRFREASTYTDINPGRTAIELRRSGDKRAMLRIAKSAFVARKSYTFIVAGGPNQAITEVIRIEDGLLAAQDMPKTSSLDNKLQPAKHQPLRQGKDNL